MFWMWNLFVDISEICDIIAIRKAGEIMNKRIKELRNALHKSQEEFGKYLGLSKSGVSEIEAGRRNVTDQHIIMLKNCTAFNINEDWLRHGTGEMFLQKSAEQELIDFTANLLIGEKDDFKKRLISALAKMTDEQWDVLESVIDDISQIKKE